MEQPRDNVVTVLRGLRETAPSGTTIEHVDTGENLTIPDDLIEQARRRSVDASCCVVVVGSDSLRFSDRRTCGENQGRSSIRLFGNQEQLVRAIAATGTPVIVVLVNGRPLASPWIAENVPAIIEAWEPGLYGGRAIAEIVFGKVNPSGRLPVTIPRSVGHVTQVYNHRPSAYFKEYVDDETPPLFEFGHGLSYTKFSYSNLGFPERIQIGESLRVMVDVENDGEVAGDEVVLVYITDRYATVTTPVRKLAAFGRVHLNPGEKRSVALEIPADRMAVYNPDLRFVVEPGEFDVAVGELRGGFTVEQ